MSSGYDPVSTTDSLLPHHSDKKSFDYDSIFNYDAPPEEKKFKSVYKYEELSNKNCYEADYYTVRDEDGSRDDDMIFSLVQHVTNSSDQTPLVTKVIMWIITSFSYIFLCLTFPLSYWWCVVQLNEYDRMVIFRLGKMQGSQGPGRVITFPWLDQCKRVDVRASAFSVPPQQFITQVQSATHSSEPSHFLSTTSQC